MVTNIGVGYADAWSNETMVIKGLNAANGLTPPRGTVRWGLGRELALAVLSRGDNVIATAHSMETLEVLQASHPDQCSVLQLDVTDTFDSLSAKAKAAVAVWGRVDVLVNNAGHGLMGTVEEAGAEGFMYIYKTNIYGVVNVTNTFLPYMRDRQSGTVVIVGSRSGWYTHYPVSPYNSSKAAIHAIADALTLELRPRAFAYLHNVIPGGHRTLAISNCRVATGKVPEYAKLRAVANEAFQITNGAENGDPKKAANAIVDVVRAEGVAEGRSLPDTLFTGSDALRDVRAKCRAVLETLDEWEDVAISIDVDQ
ncbi:hypothetical protein JB92DRAFT_3083634 [Gautieria morchelliformis]|nr:hypothetical protein JB92DRAFT_3083634 [Gautieria morchelliformis]